MKITFNIKEIFLKIQNNKERRRKEITRKFGVINE